MVKLVLWLVGLLVVVGIGAWLWFGGMLDPLLSEVGLAGEQQENTPAPQAPRPEPASELSTGSNTSDQSLETDLNTLDTQLSAYGEASAEVDSSLQDKAVTQEY